MSATETITSVFGDDANLYTSVLGMSEFGPTVPQANIRKAYYRQCLIFHPDKQDVTELTQEEMLSAKAKFQAINATYNILSNEESRRKYDEKGKLDDDCDEFDWKEQYSYFRNLTVEELENLISSTSEQFKGSDEEEKDVLKYYNLYEGDLNKCVQSVMCSNALDKLRWVKEFILPAVERGEITYYKENMELTKGSNFGFEQDATETLINADDEDEKDWRKTMKTKSKSIVKKKSIGAKKTTKSKSKLVKAVRHNNFARQPAFLSMIDRIEKRAMENKGKKKKSTKAKKGRKHTDISEEKFEEIRSKLGNKK